VRGGLTAGGFDVGVASAEVKLTLEDGSQYPLPGKIEFAEAVVDPNTGAVTLRAIPYSHWGNRGEGAMRVWIPAAV